MSRSVRGSKDALLVASSAVHLIQSGAWLFHFSSISIHVKMNDNLLIALDRIKFYAHDALVTVTQVSSPSMRLAPWLTLLPSVSAVREFRNAFSPSQGAR